jgi:hypothetical protein
MRLLFSTICFLNREKLGAEIYGTFCKRLINDVMTKTPYDILVTTNEVDFFTEEKEKWNDRISFKEELFQKHKLCVGPFNQLLKFLAIKDIPKKYDWVCYVDCDAGIVSSWDMNLVDTLFNEWEQNNYEMVATRTNCILKNELRDHEEKKAIEKQEREKGNSNTYFNPGNLFSAKFEYYDVKSETATDAHLNAVLPSEHVFLVRNNDKLQKMAVIFEGFCFKFEEQVKLDYVITFDMEAFEIGVSASMAGYDIKDIGSWAAIDILKIHCNLNNWERVKL